MRPNFEELLAYAANEITGPRADDIRRHLNENPADAALVARAVRTIATMRADDTVAPPAAVTTRAKELFAKAVRTSTPSLTETIRRIVASLTFDSRTQPALAGYRSVAQAVVLSFAVEGIEVDLQIEPPSTRDGREWRMIGQVSSNRLPAGVALRESLSGAVVREAVSEAHGGFRFAAPAGSYEIAIRIGDDEVVLPSIEF